MRRKPFTNTAAVYQEIDEKKIL